MYMFYMCVCGIYVHVCMHMLAGTRTYIESMRMSEILLYQSVPYFPEIGSLSVLGSRLAASKPQGHAVSAPHSMDITSTYNLCLPVLHGCR